MVYIPPINFTKLLTLVVMKSDEVLREIGQNISKLRKAAKLSTNELSYDTGIDKSNLVNIEKGRTNVTIKTLVKIAQALQVDLKELFK